MTQNINPDEHHAQIASARQKAFNQARGKIFDIIKEERRKGKMPKGIMSILLVKIADMRLEDEPPSPEPTP